jgi:hypothetical protein
MWYISFAGGAGGVNNILVYHDSGPEFILYVPKQSLGRGGTGCPPPSNHQPT